MLTETDPHFLSFPASLARTWHALHLCQVTLFLPPDLIMVANRTLRPFASSFPSYLAPFASLSSGSAKRRERKWVSRVSVRDLWPLKDAALPLNPKSSADSESGWSLDAENTNTTTTFPTHTGNLLLEFRFGYGGLYLSQNITHLRLWANWEQLSAVAEEQYSYKS